MAKKKYTLKNELRKIVRKRVDPSYIEKLGIGVEIPERTNVLQAIALAQVKKGLEGDLKAAEFIEELLYEAEEPTDSNESLDVVVKVVGAENGN